MCSDGFPGSGALQASSSPSLCSDDAVRSVRTGTDVLSSSPLSAQDLALRAHKDVLAVHTDAWG